MGNKCTTPTTNPLYDDSNLNDYDRTIFNLKREKVFYGTIAICVLYGSFALLLFVLSYFSDKIKYLLLNSFLPFTIVYVIGTILIVMYLIHQILNFKPYKLGSAGNYDSLSCPDYWVLERLPEDDPSGNDRTFTNLLGKSFESNAIAPEIFKYRCVMNSNIFNTYDIYKASSNFASDQTTYRGKYHFFNVSCNLMVPLRDSNLDILSDRALLNSGNDGPNYYPNQLYANVYYERDQDAGQYNKINTNIFKNDSNLQLPYHVARAALLMNNYKILNYKSQRTTNPDPGYTDFYRAHTDDELKTNQNIRDNLLKLGVTVLNFDYKTAGNTITHANSNIIRLYKSSGAARICPRPLTFTGTNGDDGVVSPCSVDDTELDGTNGYKVDKLPLNCEKIYPLYLSTLDQSINAQNRNFDANTIRCAYSKICGIPWSDMNCDKYYD